MTTLVKVMFYAIVFTLMGWSSGSALAHSFPTIQSEDLNENALTLPAELPAERTLVILAFQRAQQANVDTWVSGMSLPQSDLPWLELPIIDNPGSMGRWFINSGMRTGILDSKAREHVVSLYPDKMEFLASLGITDETAIYALIVDQAGQIIESIKGDYTPEGAATLRKALASVRNSAPKPRDTCW